MAVVATGFFDGVHPGHRLVIDTLLSEARARGEQSVVVTFWPHPRAVLQSGADSLRYLCSRSERYELLRSLGVDRVETVTFSQQFAAMSAEQYIDMLRCNYGCTELVLGYDTRFGREQTGPSGIAELARSMGLDARIVPPVILSGSEESPLPISSSRIRAALEAGDVVLAAKLLGRPYRLHGVVVAGDKIGRTIGFPTANMKLYEPLMAIPRNGVYKTSVILNGAQRSEESIFYTGLTNIGVRPTVSDRQVLTIETHILDFDEMIYGLDISLEFHERIRDERRFGSLSELQAQLQADATLIRNSL
ncbi:MAG: riboflavin biosynthesis protein RibF [Bacteroidales bacterium]|nr:riboflavin biosynthesis protein RibF [Bacteroidales bacterium]